MASTSPMIAGVGLADRQRRSRVPARLDLIQSITGGVLALFMWGHMFFVSTILVSKDFMWTVTKMFEGYFLFGKPYPGIVSVIVFGILVLFIAHAFLAVRKLPINFRQWQMYRGHMKVMKHEDTTLWWVQAITGFMLFFLVTVHLYQMLMHPGLIGPYESADRVWSGRWWPLYLVMLFAVELHGGIGLYRLAVKWGWLERDDPARTRAVLKKAKWALTVFFLALGLATLGAYMKIGFDHADRAGERYVPASVQPGAVK
jgi:fumarate reductase subunit C